MISLLARIGLPQAIGLYIDGTAVHAAGMVATPIGRLPTAVDTEPLDPKRPQEGVRRLLDRLPRPRFGRLPVAIGVPIEQAYFTTRPINVGSSDASPRVLLREVLRSANVQVDEMAVDVVQSQPDHRHVAGIVACRGDLIGDLVGLLDERDFRLVRVEPAPCALLRYALLHHGTARRAKVGVRLFLSESHVVAVLTANSQPLMWRRVQLPKGDEASAIVTVIRSLTTARAHCGIQSDPSVLVIHGRADLNPLLDIEWIQEQVQLAVQWIVSPAFEPTAIARGLAEGCFHEEATAFDLARRSKPPARLRDLIPWPEIALQAALVLLLAVFLFYQLTSTRTSQTTLTRQLARNPVSAQPLSDLQRERTQLQQQVTAVGRFVDTRILWSEYQREISDNLPENIFLTSVHGVGELAGGGKKRGAGPKRSLILKGAVVLSQNGVIPHEVALLLTALRNNPTLARDFKVVELAELKQMHQPNEDRQLAMFTIVCLPNKNKKNA